jgi:hypothetical protein
MKTRLRTTAKASVIAAAAVIGFLAGMHQSQGQGPGQRPFENTYRRPTVSPYLQLQQQGMNPLQNQNIYQTMVQPQMQQQRQPQVCIGSKRCIHLGML